MKTFLTLNFLFILLVGSSLSAQIYSGTAKEDLSVPISNPPSELGKIWIQKNYEIPGAYQISDLMDKNGNIYLFRSIRGKYIKGFLSTYAKREGMYSYSYNPQVASLWANNWADGQQDISNFEMIVGKYSVSKDVLFALKQKNYIGEGGIGTLHLLMDQVFPDTKLESMGLRQWQQIYVPLDKEQNLLVLPLLKFRFILEERKGKAFLMEQFIKELQSIQQ